MWTKLKPILWHWRGVAIAAPCTAAAVILLRLTGLLQTLEWAAYDQFFRLRPSEPHTSRIIIVGITEPDLQEYGWPLSDATLTQLLNQIKQQQPRAIGLDLYRDVPVDSGYADLVEVFRTTPNLIGVEKVVGTANAGAVAPPPVLAELGQISASDVILDADGKIRRGLLSLSNSNNELVLGFAFTLAALYLEPEEIYPELTDEEYIRLGQAVFPPLEPNDGGYVRTAADGYQILVDFRGGTGSFEVVSVQDVLESRIPPDLMSDRIVMIGAVAESLRDFYYTPYNNELLQILPPTPGVEIHANLTNQLLTSALTGRTPLQTWSEPLEWLWILGWSVVGAFLVWQQRHPPVAASASDRGMTSNNTTLIQSLKISLSLGLAGGGIWGISYLLFLANWWVPIVPAFLALGGAAIATTTYIAQSAEVIRNTFSRYLTEEIVANLLETPEGLRLGGERRKITILISDLRGFTAISEQLSPEQVVTLLNLYLERMTHVISQYNGNINEVIGDGIVVLFGAPTQRSDDAARAIACAVAMQLAITEINQQNQQLNLPTLEMGIGINTGEAIVGNIGSQRRAKYTAIGSQVNLASRIESSSIGGQVLISEATFTEVEPLLSIFSQTEVEVKGFHTPVKLYEVGGIGGAYRLSLPDPHTVLVPLVPEVPIRYALIDGRNLVGQMVSATLVKFSGKRAEVRSPHPMPFFRDIKLSLLNPYEGTTIPGDLYAKVIGQSSDVEPGFYIHFTNLSPSASTLLQNLTKV
ncbi:adenylate/guanylate cyclase domain-containing protein [Leptolyngbya sp. FACHB-541]|uniref:CHASE2 domain-containing protein n=1 Tax=Leptolyngbya sp. FACHB-541 TaxID=2692810 RepID=UPI0016856895|nr:adenylate/guanylate cyclase domain-containing protein [Leptolyngbya sp. FACHB-541]MBD2000513.1 adenylate/guanylate cyclase domain-containing protein [Leptolyngbya sp. FACHB-541]